MGFTLNTENLEAYEDYTIVARDSALARLRVSAREHLLFIHDMYKKQLQGIPVRISKRRNEMITAGVFFAFITGLIVACISIYGLIGVILSIWIIYWIAISVRDLARSVARYLIMTESKAFGLYHRYTDNFTYRSEERYCRVKMKEIEKMLEHIDTLEGEAQEKYCREMLTCEYEEKRAYAYLGSSDQRMI